MIDWKPFDANCMVGRHCMMEGGPWGELHSTEDLLEEMDHYGIAEALVVDSLSRQHHPLDGNRRVLESTAGRPRLHPAWSALPPGTDEQPAPQDLLRQMRLHKVGALFLFTGMFQFSLRDWCIDELIEPLAEARVPVFINPNDVGPGSGGWDKTDWPAIVEFCQRWPTLPVIVSEMRIRRAQRMIYRAFDACENLRLELSGYWLHHGVEYITQRWGGRRLIFGTNWPIFGQHMTLATLMGAEIDEQDKRRIAGDNLRELMRWCDVEHPQVQPKPAADAYVQFGRTGELPTAIQSNRFADCHGHLGGTAPHYHVPDGDLKSIVHEMDRLGVEKTCVFSFAGVFSDEAFGNDVVADAVRRYPERFIGFTLANPHRGRDGMLRELERGAKMGLRGIKLIPWYQMYPEDGDLIDVPCQWAHEHKQIILNHGWGTPEHMERLVSTYTNACFFTGHTTLAYAEIMKKHAHLYVCSCPLHKARECERVVQTIGADRLLFGSDLQDLPIAWGLGPILFARIPPEQKQLILGGNLRRILNRYSLE